MKIRNILLSAALLFSGIANAQEVTAPEITKTQVYKEEFEALKQDPKFKDLFDEELNGVSHQFERAIQICKAIPSRWQRFTCGVFVQFDVIAITPEMMPELYAFIASVAQKAGVSTPSIFISLNEGVFNAAAAKILGGTGGIIIFQKMLNEVPDKPLEAILAHEIGHIKGQHSNKKLALMLPALAASICVAYKGFNVLWEKTGLDKLIAESIQARILDYQLRMAALGGTMTLIYGLVIGKRFERQADQFACEAGYAQGLIEGMKIFEEKEKKFDAEILATNDKLLAAQSELTPDDFNGLQQEMMVTNWRIKFNRWIHENTPFEEHPSNADRIAAAQAYLDAQAAEQVLAIEKA